MRADHTAQLQQHKFEIEKLQTEHEGHSKQLEIQLREKTFEIEKLVQEKAKLSARAEKLEV